MKQDNQKRKLIIQYGIWMVMAALGILSLSRSISIEKNREQLFSEKVIVLDDQWEQTEEEQSSNREMHFCIPEDTGESLWVCMKTYLSEFQLFLDGQPIYSFSDTRTMQGKNQHLIRLPENSQGGQLTIKAQQDITNRHGQSRVGHAYLGQKHEVTMKLLRDNLYALLFSVFAFLLGIGAIVAGILLKKSISAEMPECSISFGIFVLIAGVWVLTDSDLLLFITNRSATVSLISFVSFMIMPVFLLRFVQYIWGGELVFDVLRRLFLFVAAAYQINFLIQVFPGYFLLFLTHMLCICSIVLVLKLGRDKLKTGRNKKVRCIMTGFLLLSVCVCAALGVFYVNPISRYSNLYCLGVLIFILCLMRAVLIGVCEQIEEEANVAAYKHLAYMDVMTGMKNCTAFMEAQQQAEKVSDLSCVMFDINDLKQINDRYGHREGNRVIIAAANAIRDTFGEMGTCFRVGGDEFVVFLKGCKEEQIIAGLDRMQKWIEEEDENEKFRLNIAVGYAVRQEDESIARMLERADSEMYKEKRYMKAGCFLEV